MRSFMMMAALCCSRALAAPPPLCTLPAPIAIPFDLPFYRRAGFSSAPT
jgi:hypothetical protein